jgi:hypothetical protein
MSDDLEAAIIDLGAGMALARDQREVLAQLMSLCDLARTHRFKVDLSLDRSLDTPGIHLRADFQLMRDPLPPAPPVLPPFLRAQAPEAAPDPAPVAEPDPAPEPASEPEPAPEPAMPYRRMRDDPGYVPPDTPLERMMPDDRVMRDDMVMHLRWLYGGVATKDTLADDLALVTGLVLGKKAQQVADDMNVSREFVIDRFRDLTHHREVTLDLQTTLVDVLTHDMQAWVRA